MYRLPSEVVTQLLNNCSLESNIDEIDIKIFHDISDQFHPKAKDIVATNKGSANGWNTVSYPKDVSLKIHRGYLQSRLKGFQRICPINRVLELWSSRKNKNQASAALKAIAEASTVRAPRKANQSLAVGAPDYNSGKGGVYVYAYDGTCENEPIK